MATIQPTPLPDSTTSEQPVDSLTTASANDGTDGDIHIQTAMYTDPVTELKVRTTSETATDLPILRRSKHTDIGLINGIVAINIIVVILSMITVVVIIAALLINKCCGKFIITAVPTIPNQAYGLNTHHNVYKGVEETIYNDQGPKVDVDNTIEAKEDEADVTNTIEGNQAYATNITTEQNTAYKPVITDEVVDEYI